MANNEVIEVVDVIVEEIKEGAAEMANEAKKVVEVEEDKVQFPIRVFLKYLGVGLLGASAGVVGKVIYDDRKTKRTTVYTTPIENTVADSRAGDEEIDYSLEF